MSRLDLAQQRPLARLPCVERRVGRRAVRAARMEAAAGRRQREVRRRAGMPTSGRIGPVSGGNERISPAVYGCSERRKSTSEGADSTISPAYMIAMRSLNSTSSERSWVMNSTAKPSRCLSVSSSCRISRCTTTSSAVVGSSITISSGSSASAIAITTRWRMPPDSSCGYERTRPRSIPTISSRSPARASASGAADAVVRLEHVDELVADPHDRVEHVHRALEDERDVPPADAPQLLLAHPDEVLAAEQDLAAGDLGRWLEDLQHGVREGALAAARFAGEPEDLAGRDRERDAVDGAHAPIAEHVLDGEVLEPQQLVGCHGHQARPRPKSRPVSIRR